MPSATHTMTTVASSLPAPWTGDFKAVVSGKRLYALDRKKLGME